MMDASFSGERYADLWGITWRHNPDDLGAMPMTTDENQVIKDITKWRDYVKFPSVENLDWSETLAQPSSINRDETLVMVPSFYGPFERASMFMTFEDTLINMYEGPEAMYELFSALID